MYIYYKNKRYRVTKDKKGRLGIWVTTKNGQRVFVPLKRLRGQVTAKRAVALTFKTLLGFAYGVVGKLSTLLSSLWMIDKLFSPPRKRIPLFVTFSFRGRVFRIPQLYLLTSAFYLTHKIVRSQLFQQRFDERLRKKSYLKEKLGENFVDIVNRPPERILSKRVPQSHLKGLACVQVRNPEVALAQLAGQNIDLHPEGVSVLGGFYIPKARVLFFSTSNLRAKRLRWVPRRVLTHEVGHHVYHLAQTKRRLEGLLNEWNRLYREAATKAWRKGYRNRKSPEYLVDPDEGFARYYAMMFAGDDQVTPRKTWVRLVGLDTHQKLLSLFKEIIKKV